MRAIALKFCKIQSCIVNNPVNFSGIYQRFHISCNSTGVQFSYRCYSVVYLSSAKSYCDIQLSHLTFKLIHLFDNAEEFQNCWNFKHNNIACMIGLGAIASAFRSNSEN